ncbi:hypothetical protein HYT24_00370 [Candidatus Pacearchaeota archaeon]|nr:hypothetical protein [Candidatus Pacearchaeota archaeon]
MHFAKPKSMLRNTGETRDAYDTMERFFHDVEEEIDRRLQVESNSRPSPYEIDRYGLHKPATETDGTIHFLFYNGKVAAVVTETRNEANFVEFNFFENIETIVDISKDKVFK